MPEEVYLLILSQMAKNANILSTMIGEILKFTCPEQLKTHLNCPPWLEKVLKYDGLQWLKMHLYCPPWLEKCLKLARLK